LWLQHRTSAHFEIGMLVMFAPASSNLSQVAPWQQHGLKIEWASLKDSVAKQIVTAAFMPSPHSPIVPSAIAGQRMRPGILSRHSKAGRAPKSSIATAADVLLNRPFVSANFEPELPSALRVPKATDRSFACLGIMMLELLFGTQLEEHELWQRFGATSTDNPVLRLMVAKKWADDVKDEAGTEFSSAVKWCLDESPATLHGDQWRKDLACEVVLPL
jgi:hypothetical protein